LADTIVVWDEFVKAFYVKHFSNFTKDRKITEFVQLSQKKLIVDQYEAKFSKLSKYAPRLWKSERRNSRDF